MSKLSIDPVDGKLLMDTADGKLISEADAGPEVNCDCTCGEATPFYQFRRCDDGTLTDWYADPADAPPGTPSVGSPWFIFDHVHQLCLYTEGDLAVPPSLDDVLQPDERDDIADCSDVACVNATETPPFDPAVCECPEGSGDFVGNLAIITVSVTVCHCNDPCATCFSGVSEKEVTSSGTTTIVAQSSGACGWTGYGRLVFDTFNPIPGPCEVYNTTWTCPVDITAGIDTSTMTWSGRASTLLLACGSSSGGAAAWGVDTFLNNGTVGTCNGVVMNNEYTECSGVNVGYNGTMTVTTLTMAP